MLFRSTWDVDSLESAIRLGLNMVCEQGIRIDSIGIDTCGVDFVLLEQQGQRVGLPVAYRDSRTNGLMTQAQQQLGKRDIYQRSGIQFLPRRIHPAGKQTQTGDAAMQQ